MKPSKPSAAWPEMRRFLAAHGFGAEGQAETPGGALSTPPSTKAAQPGPRTRRRVLLAVLAALGAALVLMVVARLPREEDSYSPRLSEVRTRPPGRPMSQAAPRRGPDEGWRLAPDRRFLGAIADLHHLLTGQERAAADARFADGRWTIIYREIEVGRLPESPDFTDAMDLLVRWAARTGGERPLGLPVEEALGSRARQAAPAPGVFPAAASLSDLAELERRYKEGPRTLALLREITRVLVALSFSTPDEAEVGDALVWRALALTALLRHASGTTADEETALLADAMGYSRAAQEAARTLGSASAVRAHVLGERDVLRHLVRRGPDHARFLAERSLGREVKGPDPGKEDEKDALLGLPRLGARLLRARSTMDEAVWYRTPTLVLLKVGKENGVDWGRPPPAASARAGAGVWRKAGGFHAALRGAISQGAATRRGPFLEPEIHEAYYRAYAYSALMVLENFYVHRLGTADAEREFRRALGTPGAGPAGLLLWLQLHHTVNFNPWEEPPLHGRLVDAMKGEMGAGPYMHLLFEIIDDVQPMPEEFARLIRRMAEHMDSRPEHRLHLARLADEKLLDTALSDRIFRALFAIAPLRFPETEIRFRARSGDDDGLRVLLHHPRLSASARMAALKALVDRGKLDEEQEIREHRRLIREWAMEGLRGAR